MTVQETSDQADPFHQQRLQAQNAFCPVSLAPWPSVVNVQLTVTQFPNCWPDPVVGAALRACIAELEATISRMRTDALILEMRVQCLTPAAQLSAADRMGNQIADAMARLGDGRLVP